MNFKNNYDSIGGIEEYLKFGLAGLRMLRNERQTAGYTREERLNEFLVLGRYYLDTCGNFSICQFSHGPNYKEDIGWLQDSLPRVIKWKSLFETIKTISSRSSIFDLPDVSSICDECGDGWNIDNAHDSIVCDRYNDPKFRHINCAKLYSERKTLKEFQEVLVKAGLENALLTPISNEYYSSDGEPWYLVRTPKGTIKIGWRKHVINIDWSELVKVQLVNMPGEFGFEKDKAAREKFGGPVLFPNENVTKGDYYIHAYGYNKLEEYLLVLSEVARIGKFAGK